MALHPTRRALLGGLGAMGGLGLGGLWTARAHAAGADQDLVVVLANGGWDVSYVLDPKPGSPFVDGPELDEEASEPEDVEATSTFGELVVGTNAHKRPVTGDFFARWAHRAVLVRGLWVGSISHDACRARVLTGTPSDGRPDVAAMVGAARAGSVPLPYMDLAGAGYTGELAALTGQSGARNQLRFLLDRSQALFGPDGTPYPRYVAHAQDRPAIDAWLADRAARQEVRRAAGAGATWRLDDAAIARTRASQLREAGPTLAQSLASAGSSLAARLGLAADLLQGGLSRTVLVDSGASWDTHDDNAEQHALHEDLFAGLDALMARLQQEGRLDRTTVVVLSEMTRTPRRNEAGGKDHWPVTSALLLGGGLAGGRVLGGTDARLDAVPVDLRTGLPSPSGTVLRYDHLAAGLLSLLDADPGRWFGGLTPLGGLTA
ncbi:MAG: DUF1501 domain-containing protein [Alphaproteobacteria bacterium]|nr:DUF1501 domain-containing protein [Alphaproteobacteria bacterium]